MHSSYLDEDQTSEPVECAENLAIAQGLLNNNLISGGQTIFLRDSIRNMSDDHSYGAAANLFPANGKARRALGTSNTWTSSDGDIPSDADTVDDRSIYIQEYNRLAKKHGVRPMVVTDFASESIFDGYEKQGNWFSRKILRRTSSSQSIQGKPEQRHSGQLKHKRSISDLSLRLKRRLDKLKDKDLQELVRLCGSSLLYLPAEYATGSLVVPTCFRATAQYLVQYAPTTRGVFRIPGSYGTVALLYNHYCSLDDGGEVISGTVRCPTLPEHINCDVHDVASAFKKFISGLPGGILGSLRLFDAFISIQTQLHGDPEWTRTKQSKIRARLIALAIFTMKSQYRRELICAVFGLLCMIGRAAEIAKREDEQGRPLPTSDLMGYGPLGIIFGPLLIGDLLENYTMRLADPRGGLILLPISPPKSRKERNRKHTIGNTISFDNYVDKIKVANGVTEMLITHWREVVRHMKNLKVTKTLTTSKSLAMIGNARPFLRPSASETFTMRRPPDWDAAKINTRFLDRSCSPTPSERLIITANDGLTSIDCHDNIVIRKQRPRQRAGSQRIITGSLSMLSPTAEERMAPDTLDSDKSKVIENPTSINLIIHKENERTSVSSRYSRRSKRGESSDTLSGSGKLRKPRPPQGKKRDKSAVKHTSDPTKQFLPLNSTGTTHESLQDVFIDSYMAEAGREVNNTKPKNFPIFSSGLFDVMLKDSRDTSKSQAFDGTKMSSNVIPGRGSRLFESEPLQKPQAAASLRRTVSKSLPDFMKFPGGPYHGKDPLLTISKDDDFKSLAALAHVIKNEDVMLSTYLYDGTLHSPDKSVSPVAASPAGILRSGLFESKRWNEHKASIGESVVSKPLSASNAFKSNGSGPSQPGPKGLKYFPSDSGVGKLKSLNLLPTGSSEIHSPAKQMHSPGKKVKALAAMFNASDSMTKMSVSTNSSPAKADVRSGSHSHRLKDNLIAPYTTNPPSPARSQKSINSEKVSTPKSSLKTQDMSYISPWSEKYKTVPEIITSDGTPSSSHPQGLIRLSPKVLQRPPSNPFKPINDSCIARTPVPPFVTEENIGRTLDGHASIESIQYRISKQNSASSLSSLVKFQDNNANSRTLKRFKNAGEATTPSDSSFKLPQVRFANLDTSSDADLIDSHTPSKVQHDAPRLPNQINPSYYSLTRSSSLLHGQILDLQKQLAQRLAEVRQLRQQLDARSNLDTGTLSEQLILVKREASLWKDRAQIAEKRLEVLTSQTTRGTISTETSQSSFPMTISRLRHGFDGTYDHQDHQTYSEETTGTMIRNSYVNNCPHESESSPWVEQVLQELADHLELD